MKKLIREFIFGQPAKGFPIYSKQPTFTTIKVKKKPDFNSWARQLNVSSGYVK